MKIIDSIVNHFTKDIYAMPPGPIDGVCQCGCEKTIKQISKEFKERSEKENRELARGAPIAVAVTGLIFLILISL